MYANASPPCNVTTTHNIKQCYFLIRIRLHLAIEKNAAPEVVQALLAAHPEGTKEPDEWLMKNMLPLHLAIKKNAAPEMVMALLASHPEGAKEPDDEGSLPLHFAAENDAAPEVVQALLAAYPEGARARRFLGRTRKTPAKVAWDKGHVRLAMILDGLLENAAASTAVIASSALALASASAAA